MECPKHWKLILEHLDYPYLMDWISSILRNLYVATDYLYLYGQSGTGKSTLGAALSLILPTVQIDEVLRADFNGNLEWPVLCLIENPDWMNQDQQEKIKKWTNDRIIEIKTPAGPTKLIPNALHFIQEAETWNSTPFPIESINLTDITCKPIENKIPVPFLMEQLTKEAGEFRIFALGY